MGRTSLKEVRQKEIVRIFYDVAKTEGLEKTSIAKIAKKMNVNPSLIIHYFESKEDLIYELIDYILEKYKRLYVHQPISEENAEVILKEMIDRLFSREWNTLIDDGVFYSCYAMTFHNKKIKKKFRELHDSLRSMLAEFLQEYADFHQTRISNPKNTAEMVFVLLEGSYYYLGLMDDRSRYIQHIERYRKEAFRIVELSLVNSEIDQPAK